MLDMGYMHLYTGDGKGKTTAAVGLTIRAAGSGAKVLFCQFLKGGETGEEQILSSLANVSVCRREKPLPFLWDMTGEEKEEVRDWNDQTLAVIKDAVQNKQYDMIVLDEITYPCTFGLIKESELKELLGKALGQVEMICTGREAPVWMLEMADYVTEMKAVKHPYDKGVAARKGVEF